MTLKQNGSLKASGDDSGQSIDQAKWPAIMEQIRLQTTRATYETVVNGAALVSSQPEDGSEIVTIGVKSAFAKDWLENRLYQVFARSIARYARRPVALRFVVTRAGESEYESERTLLLEAADQPTLDPVQGAWAVAPPLDAAPPNEDIYQVFAPVFQSINGATSYIPLSFYILHYFGSYLIARWGTSGLQALFLFLNIVGLDRRKPSARTFTQWTPALPPYSLTELAERFLPGVGAAELMGRRGYCHVYEEKKKKGPALGECCGLHEFHDFGYRTKKMQLHCCFWRPGILEVLYEEGLLAIQEMGATRARKVRLQVWRSPAILTPFQAGFLPQLIQQNHVAYLNHYAENLGIDVAAWRAAPHQTFMSLFPTGERVHGRVCWGEMKTNPFRMKGSEHRDGCEA